MRTPILIDCDPGWDDAIALLAALSKDSGLDVVGVSTVHGNADVDSTTQNACNVISAFSQSQIKIFKGAATPLIAPPHMPSWVNGPQPNLYFGTKTSEPKVLRGRSVETYVAELANLYAGQLIVVAIAPLTNIARTLKAYPEVARQIKQIVVLGGSLGPGNVTRFAEFNFYMDAKAADDVLCSPIPITILPLDVAEAAPIPAWFMTELEKSSSPRRQTVAKLLREYEGLYSKSISEGNVSIYDAIALMAVRNPGLFATRRSAFRVEWENPEEFGRLHAISMNSSVVSSSIVESVNVEALYQALFELM